ncbi:antiterminator Q family protein [Xenorhabdus innexi]|uniref:Antiterminator n=1 Tax=Xenorhabdus innexi TaxID=290109 RepID=A0A1N6N1R8_9GAMM|nr:antiterminator Q family protein [Xenorhabdus innexi]PHM37166.1 antiterminator [Xenorhabdus innexi]SIP75053.1 Phage antiterminator q protein [Xenorhabdus innexi]
MSHIREKQLTKPQQDWIDNWLNLWGAWVHSGRIDKRQINMIYKFMMTVEPRKGQDRPVCNDDDGMLISQVVDAVMCIDQKAYGILLSYYAHGASKLSISTYYHKIAKPRRMMTRSGGRLRKPSRGTCRREVDEILAASVYLLYQPLQNAFNSRKRVEKIKKIA